MSGRSGVWWRCSRPRTKPDRGGPRAPRVWWVGRLLRGVEHLEDPFGGRHTALHEVGHRGDLGERLGELAELDEGLHITDAHRATGDPKAADDREIT